MKIFAQPKGPPGTIACVTDAQVIGDKLAAIALEFVAGNAVDDVDRKMFAPINRFTTKTSSLMY
jgi:hypothetical protein